MAGIQIGDSASIMTEMTSIFNGDQEERYVILRGIRKEISASVNTFLTKRTALLAKTPAEIAADVEIEAEQGDNDQSRTYIVMNTVGWVKTAHGCLDCYNHFDNAMLGRIANYMEMIALLLGAEQFFSTPSEDDALKSVFPTRDQIVMVRINSDADKRERSEESDDSFMPPTAKRALPPQEWMMTSDSSTENIPEQLVAQDSRVGIQRAARRLSYRRAPTSALAPALPAETVAQPTTQVARRNPLLKVRVSNKSYLSR